jgi:putative hydrolase of the HAD superfamily
VALETRMTEPHSAVEAVIWDFGGVFTASPFASFARFEQTHDLPQDFIRSVNRTNFNDNAWAKAERGDIGFTEFDVQFAAESRALGHEVRGGELIAALRFAFHDDMIEALRRIRQRLKTGLITNSLPADGATDAGSKRRAEVMAMFHHVIESAAVGIRKPDPRIYALMVEALGVQPSACVYLDDLGVNLKPARDMGMVTIKVDHPGPAIAELERLVGFSLG